MTPMLMDEVSKIINAEYTMMFMELAEMQACQNESLQGYKRFHRYNATDRMHHAVKLTNYMVGKHHVEPKIVVNYTSPTTANGTFADSMKRMHDASLMHIESLKKAAKMAFDEGEFALMGELDCMIKDQMDEVEKYFRAWKEVSRVGADLNGLSDKMHCKYKKKEAECYEYK